MKGHLFESSESEVTRLILVRHGQTAANIDGRLGSRSDIPLDETGLKQVELAAQRLKSFPAAALFVSPQLRTQQTAKAIALQLNLEMQVCEELNEYYFGKISNMLIQEIEKEYPDTYADIRQWLDARPEDHALRPQFTGAERMDDFVDRILKFTETIIEKYPGKCVIAVTHLGIIKAVLTQMAGGNMRQFRSAFLADNASISIIDFYKGHPVIRLFNDTCHLNTPTKYGRIVLL